MKKIKKNLFIVVTMFTLFSTSTTVQASSQPPVTPSVVSEIDVRADILTWRYKYIDGKLYRRLFNTTTQQWASE